MFGRVIIFFMNDLTEKTPLMLEQELEKQLNRIPGFEAVHQFHYTHGEACGLITRWTSREEEEFGFKVLEPYISEYAESLGGGDFSTYQFEYQQ